MIEFQIDFESDLVENEKGILNLIKANQVDWELN